MEWIFYVIIAVMLVFFVYDKFIRKNNSEDDNNNNEKKLSETKEFPYKKRNDFLSSSEIAFYKTMKTFLNDTATICPKVAVKEIVFVDKSAGKDYMKFFNSIAKKHVDFVICNSTTMNVCCVVEIDDKSHELSKRKQRDDFINKVYEVAQIKVVHIPAKSGYSLQDLQEVIDLVTGSNNTVENKIENNNQSTTIDVVPLCPKCGIPMVKRKATKGNNAGQEFYGCSNYPQCRQTKFELNEPINQI